jgi:hypothetical protein
LRLQIGQHPLQALEFADRAAELLAGLGPFQRVIERAAGYAHGHGAGADALTVIGVHQIGKATAETGRRQHRHVRRHFEVVEGQFAFRHPAQAHGLLALGDTQAFRLIFRFLAHGEEAANPKILAALVEHAGKDQVQPGHAGAGDPVLLAVDDIFVAAFVGARGHGQRVAAGVGLGDADGGLVALQHQPRGEALLRVVAIGHDGRDRAHVGLDDDTGGHGAGLGHFLGHQDGVEEARILAAQRLRHGHAEETLRRHLLDDVEGVLLVAVDGCGARPNDLL